MKIDSVHKTIYLTGDSSSPKRPRGEAYEIWLDRTNIGMTVIHELHVNQSKGPDRRTFALVCADEPANYETILGESLGEKIELRTNDGKTSIEVAPVSMREELRLSLSGVGSDSGLGGKQYRMTSMGEGISMLVFIPSVTSGSVDAIVTDIELEAEQILRQKFDFDFSIVEVDAKETTPPA